MSRGDRNTFRDGFDYASRCCGARIRLADPAPLYNIQKFRKSCKVLRDWAGYFSNNAMKYMKDVGEDAAFEKYAFVIDLWRELRDAAHVRDQLLHVLIAGRDSTACLLSWNM